MTNLSPAAQAVLSAYEAVPIVGMYSEYYDRLAVAAALRAAVNEVFPDERDTETDLIRSDLFCIAAELEGAQ